MRTRNLLIFCVFTAFLTGSCTCKKYGGLEPASVGNDGVTDAGAPIGTTDARSLSDPQRTEVAATAVTGRKYSPSCPEGMKEVSGDYCKTVEHRCLKGRDAIFVPDEDHPGGLYVQKTIPWSCNKAEGCPVPYYCDKFVEGYAICGGDAKSLRFCIDEYEYPNVIGQKPAVMVTWYDAKQACADAGKRLCDDDEWGLACEGPDHVPYGYGWERDATACNIDRPQKEGGVNTDALGSSVAAVREAELARLDQRAPIGSFPRCVSPYGVHDMTGNVDEWANNVTRGGKPYRSIFAGGHWVGGKDGGARNRCRPRTDSHSEGFRFYAEGFRCCADAKQSVR